MLTKMIWGHNLRQELKFVKQKILNYLIYSLHCRFRYWNQRARQNSLLAKTRVWAWRPTYAQCDGLRSIACQLELWVLLLLDQDASNRPQGSHQDWNRVLLQEEQSLRHDLWTHAISSSRDHLTILSGYRVQSFCQNNRLIQCLRDCWLHIYLQKFGSN